MIPIKPTGSFLLKTSQTAGLETWIIAAVSSPRKYRAVPPG